MKIEIIGAESLGVRGLCCLVVVAEQKRFAALKERTDARWQEATSKIKPLHFSIPVPHGERTKRNEMVMMTQTDGKL